MNWKTVPLDEIQANEPRAITDGPFGSNLARRHYTESGPTVIRLQNIGDGVYIDSPAHISEDHFMALRAHEVLPGDLLVSSLGVELPRACLAPVWLGPAIVKADCIRVRLTPEVDSRWVMYSMQRPAVRRWADERRHGVGRPRLGLMTIRQIPVPLPPLEDQRRIVDILEDHLSRLGAAESYLEAGLRRLIALRRSSLDRHFGPSEPSVPLSALVNGVQAGRSFGGASVPAAPDQWGIIKVSAMTWGEFRAGENKSVAAAGIDPRYEIKQGDLLVSRANTSDYVGASVLVGPVRRKLLLSDKSLRLIPRPGVKAEWLWRALQAPSARRQISAMATGTKDSMRNISQSGLLRVALPYARADEQEDAVVRFRALDGSIRRLQEQLSAAQRQREGLRRALLAAAFSGQLTGQVGDDDVMEEVADAQTSARAAE